MSNKTTEDNFNKLQKEIQSKKDNAKQQTKNKNSDQNVDKSSSNQTPKEETTESYGTKKDDKIVLKRKDNKSDHLKRQTYYMTDELIEQIDKVSELSGYGKSRLIRMATKAFLEKLEIK